MVKLQSKDDPSTSFYFENMKQCKKFIHVFEDHWCNIRWNSPIESDRFSEMDSEDWSSLYESPKKRAEDNLCWGFALEKFLNRGFNNAQKEFVANMNKKLS